MRSIRQPFGYSSVASFRIEPLGASFSVTSVAQALHPFHPNYYFLIDRDHHDDDFVERCWRNFPNEDELNLIGFGGEEKLENYFLEPSYLAHSKYIVADVDRLREGILERAQREIVSGRCQSRDRMAA